MVLTISAVWNNLGLEFFAWTRSTATGLLQVPPLKLFAREISGLMLHSFFIRGLLLLDLIRNSLVDRLRELIRLGYDCVMTAEKFGVGGRAGCSEDSNCESGCDFHCFLIKLNLVRAI